MTGGVPLRRSAGGCREGVLRTPPALRLWGVEEKNGQHGKQDHGHQGHGGEGGGDLHPFFRFVTIIASSTINGK